MLRKLLIASLLALVGGVLTPAQTSVPIISGGLSFVSTTNAGVTFFPPILSPLVTVPIGDKWLIESRGTLDEFVFRENGTSGPYHALTFTSVDYLQLDYVASSRMTISVGRYLTPFGIYNERLGPEWIKNIEDPPLIYGIGTRASGSSDGAMVRGVAVARSRWELNYTAYFSALSTANKFEAGRAAGGRAGIFLPGTRLEFGASYQRYLQDTHLNAAGLHFAWQPFRVPVDIKAEYAHSPSGHGYWLETAYRFSKYHGPTSAIGRLQAVGRVQDFERTSPGVNDALPGVDTQRMDIGLNYYLPRNVRLNASYGRQFSSAGNSNIWNFAISYRFLFPIFPGRAK